MSCLHCVYSLLVLLSKPASTDSSLYSVCGVRSRIVVVFVAQLIDRYSYLCVFLVLLLYLAGSAQIFT